MALKSVITYVAIKTCYQHHKVALFIVCKLFHLFLANKSLLWDDHVARILQVARTLQE